MLWIQCWLTHATTLVEQLPEDLKRGSYTPERQAGGPELGLCSPSPLAPSSG